MKVRTKRTRTTEEMRNLPLYTELPGSPIETSERLPRDSQCTRCPLHQGVRTVCVPAAGQPGGVLFVGEGPGPTEDAHGKPFAGSSGNLLFEQAKRFWDGPIAVANATGCYPKANKARAGLDMRPSYIEQCRPYLARVIEDMRPARIIGLGAWAALALAGRKIAPLGMRRAYSYLYREPIAWAMRDRGSEGDSEDVTAWAGFAAEVRSTGVYPEAFGSTRMSESSPIPVFFVMHPAAALRNRLLESVFRQDLEYALKRPPPSTAPLRGCIHLVESGQDAELAISRLRAASWSAVDIEASGVLHNSDYRIVSIAATPRGGDAAFFWSSTALANISARRPLEKWLADSSQKKIGAHFQYDACGVERALGVRLNGIAGDVRLWRRLLESHGDGKLSEMVELVGMGGMKEEADAVFASVADLDKARAGIAAEKALEKRDLQPEKKWPKLHKRKAEGLAYLRDLDEENPRLASLVRRFPSVSEEKAWMYEVIAEAAPDVEARYNCRDAVGTARLGAYFEERFELEPAGMTLVKNGLVDRAIAAIARVEYWGIAASREAIYAFDAWICGQLAPVTQRLSAYGVDNWNSVEQVAEFLFRKLNLKSVKKTKGGKNSTAADVLEALAGAHPAVDDLLEYRALVKLRGTYAAGSDGQGGMLKHIRDDGRIHCTIYLDGAETGRTSAANPNLMTLPKKDPIASALSRNVFAAEPGKVLLSVDQSQIELRVAAELSGDKAMMAIFERGEDYHMRTAQLIARDAWGIRPEDVSDVQRTLSKPVTFGLLYGKGISSLACDIFKTDKPTKHQISAAQKISDAVLGAFPQLARWIRACIAETTRTGEMWVPYEGQAARRRSLWDIADKDDFAASRARNGSFNGIIQGRASDILIEALASTIEWILDEGLEACAKAVLPIHDQILSEVAVDYLDEVVAAELSFMEDQRCAVPLVADVEVGPAWGSLRKLKRSAEGWRCFVRKDSDGRDVYTNWLMGPKAAYEAAVSAS